MEKNQQNVKSSSDKKKVQQILKGFDPNISEAVMYLKTKYGDLKQYEYLQIAEYCTEKIPSLTLDRESKRRKEVLLKWYHDNFFILKPILDNIVVENENHELFGERANDVKKIFLTKQNSQENLSIQIIDIKEDSK